MFGLNAGTWGVLGHAGASMDSTNSDLEIGLSQTLRLLLPPPPPIVRSTFLGFTFENSCLYSPCSKVGMYMPIVYKIILIEKYCNTETA